MLPRIEPVIDAFTTTTNPLDRAVKERISSGALPNVALSNPSTPGPARALRCSVARPSQAASGMSATPEIKNSKVSFFQAGMKRTKQASGTATRNQSSGRSR
jgi:hypothetical protein